MSGTEEDNFDHDIFAAYDVLHNAQVILAGALQRVTEDRKYNKGAERARGLVKALYEVQSAMESVCEVK